MIKTPELEQALLVLPFSLVEPAAKYLVRLLEAGLDVELCARSAIFLLRVHQVRSFPLVASFPCVAECFV